MFVTHMNTIEYTLCTQHYNWLVTIEGTGNVWLDHWITEHDDNEYVNVVNTKFINALCMNVQHLFVDYELLTKDVLTS